MRKIKLKPIKDKVPAILVAKPLLKVPTFVVEGSTPALLKGFSFYETPDAITLNEWYLPDTQINNSSGLPGFRKIIEFTGGKVSRALPDIFKTDFTEPEMVDIIVELMAQHLPAVQQVNNLGDLERVIDEYLTYEAIGWVGLANYAVWLTQLGKLDKALECAKTSLDKAGKGHPCYGRVVELHDALAQGQVPSELLAMLKQETMDVVSQAGFYKKL